MIQENVAVKKVEVLFREPLPGFVERFRKLLRLLLATLLVVLGASKFTVGIYGIQELLLPEWVVRALGGIELGGGLLLAANRAVRPIAIFVVTLAAVGIVASLIAATPCGCLGSLVALSPPMHRILAGVIGCLALSQTFR